MHIEFWTNIEFWRKNKHRKSLYIKQKDLFFQLKKETLTTFKGDQSINQYVETIIKHLTRDLYNLKKIKKQEYSHIK